MRENWPRPSVVWSTRTGEYYTQFILITHSKYTMVSAVMLYGFTIQDSGIWRRIAIHFKDWLDEETAQHNPTV